MQTSYEQALEFVLQSEGGFVNDPKDPGGATNHGVTQRTYEAYIGHSVSIDDMKALSVANVAPIYAEKYWTPVRGDELPAGVDLCVFDFGVNAGPSRAAKVLQQCVGVANDGVLGPNSMRAVASSDPHRLIGLYSNARAAYYKGLPTFSRFGRGWLDRVNRCQALALTLAG